MKKRVFCLILSALMLLSFAACGDVSDNSSDISSEESKVIILPTINGVSLADFTVVYKDEPEVAQKHSTAAESFVTYVKDTFGVELKCIPDSQQATDNEIIFGLAKRDIADKNKVDFNYGHYKTVIEGTKVLFAASYANGSNAAAEDFCKKIEESADGVFGDTAFEGDKEIIKVACVGDSITQGINSTNPKTMTYPYYIQQMLGLDYYVLNAGISAYSICKIDPLSYDKHSAYQQALALKPDVVLFALGTNDANPDPTTPTKNWDNPANDRVEVFNESTNELLDSFVDVNPDVQIFMVLPASLFKVGDDHWNAEPWTANIVKYSHPLLKAIAEERELPIVDLFDWSVENKSVFTDGLHPKDTTYKTFAQYIYDCIKDTIKTVE